MWSTALLPTRLEQLLRMCCIPCMMSRSCVADVLAWEPVSFHLSCSFFFFLFPSPSPVGTDHRGPVVPLCPHLLSLASPFGFRFLECLYCVQLFFLLAFHSAFLKSGGSGGGGRLHSAARPRRHVAAQTTQSALHPHPPPSRTLPSLFPLFSDELCQSRALVHVVAWNRSPSPLSLSLPLRKTPEHVSNARTARVLIAHGGLLAPQPMVREQAPKYALCTESVTAMPAPSPSHSRVRRVLFSPTACFCVAPCYPLRLSSL